MKKIEKIVRFSINCAIESCDSDSSETEIAPTRVTRVHNHVEAEKQITMKYNSTFHEHARVFEN